MSKLKDVKSNFIIETATSLFLARSIEEVTIHDIALEAGIGEATIYRYFGKKQAIAIASISKVLEQISKEHFQMEKGRNGFEKLSIFYHSYLDVFVSAPHFYRLLSQFDAFIAGEDPASLSSYEQSIISYKAAFFSAYEEGLRDGSVAANDNIDLIYFSTTHALLELCKKLSLEQGVLALDEATPKKEEIECLISLFLRTFTPCVPSARKANQEDGRN